MAQTKSKSQSKKKAASRFYVVRSIHDVRKNVTERVESYHQDYIKAPIESGKEVVEDFRDDPRQALDNMVDDGCKFVVDLKKDAKKRVRGVAVDSRKFYRKAKKNPRKTFTSLVDDGKDMAEDLLEDGKAMMKGVEKDARLVLDEMADSGKKALDNFPGKKKLQQKIEKRIKTVPLRFNMPTRKDINQLMSRLDDLNTKIDTLGKAYTA